MRFKLTLSLLAVILTSCTLTNNPPTPAPTVTQPVYTPIPTFTATLPPTPESGYSLPTSETDRPVALDFVTRACEAGWSNNAYHVPCPGDLTDISRGYMEYTDHTVIEGMISIEAPLLIMLPGQGNGNGTGLFGHYPALTVLPGDTFQSVIACQGDAPCNVEFALEYFDVNGNYHSENRWQWRHHIGDGPTEINLDLSALAGQTLEFLLVIREKGAAQNAWSVWVDPRITRDPNAQPVPTLIPQPTATLASDKTPGSISGYVDMSTAPPYLNDPIAGSMPVVVIFFNLDDGTYWYIQTSLTGHPNYQMTVTPGTYQVVAYARGVGGEPYVTAGYTGQNPSCGKKLQTVTVAPNAQVNNIVIADWNWKCGGTASRPAKPADVPIP